MTALAYPERLRDRHDVHFAYRFAFLTVATMVGWAVASPSWAVLRAVTTRVVTFVTGLTGLPSTVGAGDIVTFTPNGHVFSYHVTDECTGAAVMATYLVAVAAYPVNGRAHLLGLLGVPLLAALNVVRLVVLGWVGVYWPNAFDDIHLYWWQAFYIAGTGSIWFAWAWFTGEERYRSSTTWRRLRDVAAPAGTALAVLVVMAVLARAASALTAYGTVIRSARTALTDRLWGPTVRFAWAEADTGIVEYALLTAVVALFLTAPGIDVRRRVRGVLLVGVPASLTLMIAVPVLLLTVQVALGDSTRRVANDALISTTAAGHLGVALVAWYTWLARERRRHDAREARRRAARHGATHRLAPTPRPRLVRRTQWLDRPILPMRELRGRRPR